MLGKRERDEGIVEEEEIEEEENNKLLYVCFLNSCAERRWFSMDVRRFGDYETIEELAESEYPSNLKDRVRGYAMVALKSSIYFLGGEVRNEFLNTDSMWKALVSSGWDHNNYISNKVIVYDTISKKWYGGDDDDDRRISPMLSPRVLPTTVAAKDRIYVFGTTDYRHLELDTWSEVYYPNSNQWEYLPSPPQELLDDIHGLLYHVVHGDLIYFWFYPVNVVYSFHLDNHVWVKLDFVLPLLPLKHYWSERVAIVDGVLLYHFYGTIYGYNLKQTTCMEPKPLYTLSDDDRQLFGYWRGPSVDTSRFPTYLVDAGDGFLLLIWSDPFKLQDIHCYSFRLAKNEDASLALEFVSGTILKQDCLRIYCILDL